MRRLVQLVSVLLVSTNALLLASDEAPRWGFLGDDEQLKLKFEERREVALICVFDTEVNRIPYPESKIASPFADIVFHATVVSVHKGSLKVGQKIKIRFLTDSLEGDADQQRHFIEATNARNKGALKFAFLKPAKNGEHSCEWLDLPDFTSDMQRFLERVEVEASKAPQMKTSRTGPKGSR